MLPFSSTLASFSPPADLEVFIHLPNFSSQSALSARKCMFLLPFALLPAAFSTFSTWNTLILQLALCLLYSAQFLPGHSPYQLATFSSMVSWWPHSFSQPFPAPSFQTALSASSLHNDSTHNCHLFLTSQHIKKAKVFGRSQDQNHLQQLRAHLIIVFDKTGSAASSDHSLAALISPSFLQNLPSSSYSMHWSDRAAEQDWWSFWILWGRQPCYGQIDCSLSRMRIISKNADFCCLYLRNQICMS